MIININNNTVTVDGIAAGTIADAITAYPAYTAELWSATSLQLERMTAQNKNLIASALQRSGPVESVPPNPRVITNTQFKAKFTTPQLVQTWRLSLTDDNVALLLFDVFTRTTINLDDQRTIDGLNYLVYVGVALDLTIF
jgi:hypothetical protein